MKRVYVLLAGLMFAFNIIHSQTTTIIGVMSVYTALSGKGCDANCNEGALYNHFSPFTFCNTTGTAVAAGSATEEPMWISFNIPNACSVTVKGEYGSPYREHGGTCPDSRMDNDDLLGIAKTTVTDANVLAGSVTNVGSCTTYSGSGSTGVVAAGCSGASNAEEGVSYTTSGPITVSVYGTSNRSDEVITYTVTGTGSACSTIGVIVLPIELIGFSAYKNTNNTINLQWATLTETNNDYFMLEYSSDAVNFIPYVKVKGAGNSFERKDYSCVFSSDLMSNTFYFRLKQVDYNGNFSYSPIISAGTSAAFVIPSSSLIGYYSTEKEKVVAKFHLDYPQQVSLKLFDLSGQEMYSSNDALNEGDNEILINSPNTSGTYILVYQNGTSSPVHKKVMVIK